jgi:hypothetical protein
LPYFIASHQIDPYSVSSPTLSVPTEVRSVLSNGSSGPANGWASRLPWTTRVVITSTGGISRRSGARRGSSRCAESLLAAGFGSFKRGGFFLLQSMFGRNVQRSNSFSSARLLRSSSSTLLVRARFCSRLTPS